MNSKLQLKWITKVKCKIKFWSRLFDCRVRTNVFSDKKMRNIIGRVYIINLDRKPNRWKQVKKELNRIHLSSNKKLYDISRRVSAVDARFIQNEIDYKLLNPYYSLSDQFKVEPNYKYIINDDNDINNIKMSTPEIAVTLSHINVWKKIIEDNVAYALILEDDVYFTYGFAKIMDKVWNSLMNMKCNEDFDILFLSYERVKGAKIVKEYEKEIVHRPYCGIWQASGYVLSKRGAEKLLSLLPVYGPVDLWLNLQFPKLDVFITNKPIIEQRADLESSNSYSIMPVLTRIGIYNDEKPLISKQSSKLPMVLAYGEYGSGLSSLALALSMLGYSCCSDLMAVPYLDKMFERKKKGCFNAYVNVGEMDVRFIKRMLNIYVNLKIIITTREYNKMLKDIPEDHILYLLKDNKDKWKSIAEFLKVDYPTLSYPEVDDKGKREYEIIYRADEMRDRVTNLKFDTSPWIVSMENEAGFRMLGDPQKYINQIKWEQGKKWRTWLVPRRDTFPSNLSIFSPNNILDEGENPIKLILKKQKTNVREYTSASIVSKKKYQYGRFCVELKPADVPGLVTGIFLHRNSPHQEIDIEFLGKDTSNMLLNVFYNPGIDGTRLEYGYRGTPVLIKLGFDASKEFHRYEIEWNESYILWSVDGKNVYRRDVWQPTPIPDLPMEFNINLWYSQSKKLAGILNEDRLPACSEIKSLYLEYNS